jgi:hypothetical protein
MKHIGHDVDPAFAAALLAELRRRARPALGRTLARKLGVKRLRTIQETVWWLRCRRKRIVSGRKGYALARSRTEVDDFVQREERRMAHERLALRGVKAGHSRQTTVASTRTRRAA